MLYRRPGYTSRLTHCWKLDQGLANFFGDPLNYLWRQPEPACDAIWNRKHLVAGVGGQGGRLRLVLGARLELAAALGQV
jgi:hypothetical protein